MMRITQIVPLSVACLSIAALDPIAAAENQFDSIAVRNVFGLVPLPIPLRVAEPQAAPKVLPHVVVTGLTDVSGRNQVLMEVTEPGKPVTRLILQEGARFGSLEVLSINLEMDRVKILVSGETVELRLARAFKGSGETGVAR